MTHYTCRRGSPTAFEMISLSVACSRLSTHARCVCVRERTSSHPLCPAARSLSLSIIHKGPLHLAIDPKKPVLHTKTELSTTKLDHLFPWRGRLQGKADISCRDTHTHTHFCCQADTSRLDIHISLGSERSVCVCAPHLLAPLSLLTPVPSLLNTLSFHPTLPAFKACC